MITNNESLRSKSSIICIYSIYIYNRNVFHLPSEGTKANRLCVCMSYYYNNYNNYYYDYTLNIYYYLSR